MSDMTYFRIGVPNDMVADIMWHDDFEVSMEPRILKHVTAASNIPTAGLPRTQKTKPSKHGTGGRTMETKLLPCPHCGGEAELDEYCGRYVVFCKNSKCSWRDTEDEAIEAWNTRRYVPPCDGCIAFNAYDWCHDCARSKPDLYQPKEDTDAD